MKQRHLYALGLLVAVGFVLSTVPASATTRAAATPKAPTASVTWASGAPLPFAATRWDGEIVRSLNRVFFLGYRKADNLTDGSVWYYDVATATYVDTGVDMPVPDSNYEVSALTDASGVLGLYIFGGRAEPAPGVIVDTVQAYFPATNTASIISTDPWPGKTPSGCISLPAMGVATVANRAFVMGGVAFTANGCVADENSAQTWIFQPRRPAGARWSPGPPLNLARGYITTGLLGRTIYAIGGDVNVAGSLTAQPIVESWAPPTGGWNDAAVANLPVGCDESQAFGFSAGPLANDVVLAGCGQWPNATGDTYIYSSTANTWSVGGTLLEARRNHAGVLLGSKMFVLGGYDSTGGVTLMTTELGTGHPLGGNRPGYVGPDRITGGNPATS